MCSVKTNYPSWVIEQGRRIEQRTKDALRVNQTASWAKNQLRILADTLADREGMEWIAKELREIEAGIEVMRDANERGNLCPN
jgi:hypothetical protein